MGGWKLEVGKMALYLSFPVAMFYYFNQPQYFEEWVVKTKREMYHLDIEGNNRIKIAIQEIRREQEAKRLDEIEKEM